MFLFIRFSLTYALCICHSTKYSLQLGTLRNVYLSQVWIKMTIKLKKGNYESKASLWTSFFFSKKKLLPLAIKFYKWDYYVLIPVGCMSLFLYSYMLMMFYSHILWIIRNTYLMYRTHSIKSILLAINVNNTKLVAIKAIQAKHQKNRHLGVKVSSTNRWKISYAFRLQVG